MSADFSGAFAALRRILKKHSSGMVVQTDTPTDFTLVSRAIGPNRKPMWFGAVKLEKSAVTYHLMPLYFNPTLQAEMTPELAARKQGKTCFNFQRPDAELYAQLDLLTEHGREHWERHGLLEPGAVPPEGLASALRAGGEDPEALARLRKSKGEAAANKRTATIKKKGQTPMRRTKSAKTSKKRS